MFGNMGMGEWALVLVIVLIFFGAKNLPKLAQSIGRSVRELKNGLNGLGDDIKDTLQEPIANAPVKPQPDPNAASRTEAQPAPPAPEQETKQA